MKKSTKIIVAAFGSLIVAVGLTLGIAFTVLAVKTNKINDDWSEIYTNAKYDAAVEVGSFEVKTQEISCGYAVIEMFSVWNGGNITEQILFN